MCTILVALALSATFTVYAPTARTSLTEEDFRCKTFVKSSYVLSTYCWYKEMNRLPSGRFFEFYGDV